jgi:hypothetical protein
MRFVLFFAWLGTAHALTPLPDNSPSFFSGEWSGAGEHGAYCYINLSTNGWGWVLIDSGAGDWLGAKIQWRNLQQALQVEKVFPIPTSHQLRIIPLENFMLSTGFNQYLRLTWSKRTSGCHLQKLETSARHLDRARSAIEGLLHGEKR